MSGKIKKVFSKIVEFISGDVLINKGLDRHLGIVFYIFCLICLFIMWSLTVESQLARVQDNEKVLQDLRINYQQRTLDIVGMNNRTKVDNMLDKCHSTLVAPEDPPTLVKLK